MFFGQPVAGTNKVVTVPAPVGGLNARDSLAAMPPTDAIVLNNWWPQPYGCLVRKGYIEWATGLPAEVQSLWPWSSVDGDQKLFAWSADEMHDVTARAAVGAPLLTGLSNAVWEAVQLVNTGGSHLIAVNGVDDAIIYNASGVNRIILGGGGAGTWAGIDPKDAVQVTVHQSRLWAVEKDSSVGWYFPIQQQFGIAQAWDFGPLFSRGGFLQFLTTWTLDDGNGAEDHLIAMSSRGEAVVYAGGDPAATDGSWRLVGVYYIGAPVSGRRGFAKAAGDQIIITQQGIVSMTAKLISTKVTQNNDIINSLKIQFLLNELIRQYTALPGWELQYFPRINMVLVNVPSVTVDGDLQLASNQITGAWTQFSGMIARSWASFLSSPFFGSTNGTVYRAWEGNSDGVLLDNTGGTGVRAQAQQAYNYYDQLATQKQISMYRPTFVVSEPINFRSNIQYDFTTNNLNYPDAIPGLSSSLWDVALWDSGTWFGGTQIQKSWVQAIGMGVAASLRLATQTDAETLWVATDYSLIGGKGLF